MRILLRVIAVIIAVAVILTVKLVWRFWHLGGFKTLIATGTFGWITIFGWLIALVLGPFATVQLWRFREIGRITSLVLLGYNILYYGMGWVFLRGRTPISYAPTFLMTTGFNALLAATLLSASARRLCSKWPTTRPEPL
jgi:hypothetical protein